ncbi:MAG: hypothetical protein ACI9Z9_002083 [Litorivivens sp.]|jgi:hypothetical protein
MVAASMTAERKTVGLLSQRVATRLQFLILPNIRSIRCERPQSVGKLPFRQAPASVTLGSERPCGGAERN